MRSPHRDRLKPVPRPPISTDCHRSDNPGSNCLFWLYLSSLLAVLRSPVRSFRLISSICSCTAQAGRGVREKKTRRAPALDDDVRRRGSSICAGVKKIQLVGNVGFGARYHLDHLCALAPTPLCSFMCCVYLRASTQWLQKCMYNTKHKADERLFNSPMKS